MGIESSNKPTYDEFLALVAELMAENAAIKTRLAVSGASIPLEI